jgi:LAGLIDADG DNA endonuclease family protein
MYATSIDDKPRVSAGDGVEIRRLYLEERLSVELVSRALKLGRDRVRSEIRRQGIFKSRSQAKLDAALRGEGRSKYDLDLNLLQTWTADSAWVWGIWFGDGWLSPPWQFGFSGDKQVLIRIQELLNTTAPLWWGNNIKNKAKGWRLCVGSVAAAHIIEQMFGLKPGKKSRILTWPSVPGRFEVDFLRGLWDADGCWGYTTAKGKRYLQATFGSTSRPLVESVRDLISSRCDVRLRPVELQKKKKKKYEFWVVRWHSHDGARIGNWMYAERSDLNRSSRKYERWLELIPR